MLTLEIKNGEVIIKVSEETLKMISNDYELGSMLRKAYIKAQSETKE
jgi:hypothetical protein